MQKIEIKTAQNVTIEYEMAALRERVLAYLIDLVIVYIAAVAIFYTLIVAAFALDDFNIMRAGGYVLVFSLILYQFLFELFRDGQSIGKKLLKIKVVRLDGRQPSAADHLLRSFFQLPDALLSAGILAALFISTTAKKQRLGDMTANTTVIRTNSELQFRLEDILKIDSLAEYDPIYPEVTKLADQDMLLIKKVITRTNNFNNPAHSKAINELVLKVCKILEVPLPKGNRIEFLKTLLKDYIVLTR